VDVDRCQHEARLSLDDETAAIVTSATDAADSSHPYGLRFAGDPPNHPGGSNFNRRKGVKLRPALTVAYTVEFWGLSHTIRKAVEEELSAKVEDGASRSRRSRGELASGWRDL